MSHPAAGLLAASILMSAAYAQTGEAVVIDDFYGTIEIELHSSGPITALKSGPNASEVTIEDGRTVRIDGGEEIDRKRWWKTYQKERKSMGGWGRSEGQDKALEALLEDRPTLRITAPKGTDIQITGSAFKLTAEGEAGRIEIGDNVHLWAKLGDAETADVSVHGSGYLMIGDVAGSLDADVHGSGDIVAGRTGRAELSVHGSGDLNVKGVSGPLQASVHGSGDIDIEEAMGDAELSVHGSGDLRLARVEGDVKGNVHGSGDLVLERMEGALEASVHGSGDFDVGRGEISRLIASVRGSGEFSFDGTAQSAVLRSYGSGDIEVAEVTGRIEADGKNIRANGQRVGGKSR